MPVVSANECSQQDALRELAELDSDAWVIVDFDRTLFCENSTEQFFAQAAPAPLAMAIVSLARGLAFYLYAGDRRRQVACSDPWALLAICCLMPWALIRWRYFQAPRLRGQLHSQLRAAICRRSAQRVLIASLGSRLIIEPLLRDLPSFHTRLAPLLWAGTYRMRGKLAIIDDVLTPSQLACAWGAGDSIDDVNWLAACQRGHLREWSESPAKHAFCATYLPGAYTTFAKYPRRAHFLRTFLGEDVVVVCLAAFWPMLSSWRGWAAGAICMLGFLAVYELGYVENDEIAAAKEAKPQVFAGRFRHRKPAGIEPWLWSLGAAMLLANLVGVDFVSLDCGLLIGYWLLWMAVTRTIFWNFNRRPPSKRSTFFALLQLSKYAGALLFFGSSFLGVALVLAQILRQHTNYLIYRFRGDNHPFYRQRYRALVFVMIAALGGCTGAWSFASDRQQLLAIAAWLGLRVYFEGRRFARFRVEQRYADYLDGHASEPEPADSDADRR